jgi:hypothetical protein
MKSNKGSIIDAKIDKITGLATGLSRYILGQAAFKPRG